MGSGLFHCIINAYIAERDTLWSNKAEPFIQPNQWIYTVKIENKWKKTLTGDWQLRRGCNAKEEAELRFKASWLARCAKKTIIWSIANQHRICEGPRVLTETQHLLRDLKMFVHWLSPTHLMDPERGMPDTPKSNSFVIAWGCHVIKWEKWKDLLSSII